jgi:uncharacterized phiE125 gp8 family phage protein
MLKRLTPPAKPALGMSEAKQHLRVDHDFEDELIRDQLAAAIAFVEDHTGRAMASAEYEETFPAWPSCGYLNLAVAPVTAVANIAYMDEAGVEQILAGTDETWYWRATHDGARVTFTEDFTAPTLWGRPDDVVVRFTAGYNAPNNVAVQTDRSLDAPAMMRTVVKLLLGDWYTHREQTIAGTQIAELPTGVMPILNQLRIYR